MDEHKKIIILPLAVRPKKPTTPKQNIQKAPVFAVSFTGSNIFVDGGGAPDEPIDERVPKTSKSTILGD